jgi:hypothetical protein
MCPNPARDATAAAAARARRDCLRHRFDLAVASEAGTVLGVVHHAVPMPMPEDEQAAPSWDELLDGMGGMLRPPEFQSSGAWAISELRRRLGEDWPERAWTPYGLPSGFDATKLPHDCPLRATRARAAPALA